MLVIGTLFVNIRHVFGGVGTDCVLVGFNRFFGCYPLKLFIFAIERMRLL